MIQINKTLVDEIIRLTKKYYRTGDIDILAARHIATDSFESSSETHDLSHIADVIKEMSKLAHYIKLDNSQIYAALIQLGYEVQENTEENK